MRSVFQDAVASVLRFWHRDEGSSKLVEPQGVKWNEVGTKMAKDELGGVKQKGNHEERVEEARSEIFLG